MNIANLDAIVRETAALKMAEQIIETANSRDNLCWKMTLPLQSPHAAPALEFSGYCHNGTALDEFQRVIRASILTAAVVMRQAAERRLIDLGVDLSKTEAAP
jgi:hypothetical protein